MTEPLGGNAKEQLKSIVERVEHLLDEIDGLRIDVSDIYKEAKGNGYDAKALRKIVRIRAQDATERANQDAILDSYMLALGTV